MERFVILLYLSFAIVFFVIPATLVIADKISSRAHAYMSRRWRQIRREIVSRMLAADGLTVRPMTETETALAPISVEVAADEMLEIIGRWSE